MGHLIALGFFIYLCFEYGFWWVIFIGTLIIILITILSANFPPTTPEPATPRRAKGVTRTRKNNATGFSQNQELNCPMGYVRTGLVIDEPWISKITGGEKTWEMRSTTTKKRERIALIKKGSGTIVGTATIKDVVGPFNDDQISANFGRHRVPINMIGKWRYGWVLENVNKLETPVPYVHRNGAVTWVSLDSAASRKVSEADSADV